MWGVKLSYLILFAVLAMLPIGSWAETWTDSYGNTWYYDVDNQEATITNYTQNGSYVDNLVIPEKMGDYPVVAIDNKTFDYTFSSVTIPATVKEIGLQAFQSFIEKIICKGETPAKVGTNAFQDDNMGTLKIYVPQSAVDTYKTAWTAYASYIKQNPAGTIFTYDESQYRINDDNNTVTLIKAGGWSSELNLESAYYYDSSSMSSTYYNVSAIAENAFAGNTTITRIHLPYTLTSIGDNAFANSNVSEIFAENYTPAEIGKNVFSGISNLKIYVNESCFSDYQSKWKDYAQYITKKPIGETFTVGDYEYTIKQFAFYDGTAKISKYNGKESTIDLSNHSNVTYNDKLYHIDEIGAEAFKGNTTINKVILPYSYSNIGAAAFANCSNLSTVICKNDMAFSLSSEDVFSGCANDLIIYVPSNSVDSYKTAYGWSAFASNIQANKAGTDFSEGDFGFVINDDMATVTVTSYSGSATDVTVPSSATYNGETYAATSLGYMGSVFSNSNIETVTIPASIASVGYQVFYSLPNLKSVFFLSKTPVYISNEAFMDCYGYNLYVPQGTVNAYKEANSNSSYTFKEDLRGTDYQDGNFVYHFNNDLTLTLKEYKGTDETMVTIARKVKKDDVTYTVTSIADKVFADKNFIKTFVVMGDTLINMEGTELFANHASDMVIYVLPSMVDAYKAAEGWSGYAQYIQTSPTGKSFTSGDYTYVLNEDLQSVGVSYYSGSTMESPSTEVVIPSEFTDSESGKTYPVTTIKSNAFSNIYAQSIVIPASIALIEENAISGYSINTIQILGNATSIRSNAFGDFMMYGSRYILVPEDAYDHYMNSYQDGWSSYSNYIAVLGESMDLTDETALPSKRYLFKSGTLTYRRTVAQAGQYATLVLPFEINVSDNNGIEAAYSVKDMMIHYLNNTANNNEGVEKFILMLTKQSHFYAGYPMILKLADGNSEISITNTDNVVLDPNAYINSNMISVVDWDGTSGIMEDNNSYNITRSGTYEKKDVSQLGSTVYTFNPDGTFGPQTSGSINPFRMYLDVYNYSTPMCYSISIGVNDGGTTGIRELVTTPVRKNSHAVYDINGRLVNMNGSTEGLSKGIYIIGNKKVIVNK